MTTPRNSTPRHVWDALRRLRNCNKQQLAAALGVSSRTLARWTAATEAGTSPGAAAERAASDLLIATLRAANEADVHAQWRINWPAIGTIAGRR